MSDREYARLVKARLRRVEQALALARKDACRAKAQVRCLQAEIDETRARSSVLRLLRLVGEERTRERRV